MNTTSSTMANIPHSANGDYVVLVHGLARTRHCMRKAQHFFRQQGYIVLNFGYPSTKYPIEIISERYLKTFIQTQCADLTKTIHFITHSMGGILVRFYLKNHKPDNLGRVVMLAPPNQGSEVTDWLKESFVYRWIFGLAGQQLGTDARSLPLQLGPVEFELGIIAGDRSINPINSLKIPGQDDGKVSVDRTKVQGMKDFLLVHNNHTFIMRDKHVLMQTEHFLRNGMFRRESDA